MISPKIGDKVSVSYRYWTNKGACVTKMRKGRVKAITPFDNGTSGYNVLIGGFLRSHWHAIDQRNAKLAFEGYPEWGQNRPKSAQNGPNQLG